MNTNKKIKNATAKTYLGIHFRSLTEIRVYKRLVELGYQPAYEPDTIVLSDHFRPTRPWYMDGVALLRKKQQDPQIVNALTYTPDFRIHLKDGSILYIEVKGHPNDSYPIKRKLFLQWIEQQKKVIHFAEIHTVTGLNKLMKQFG